MPDVRRREIQWGEILTGRRSELKGKIITDRKVSHRIRLKVARHSLTEGSGGVASL